MRLKRLELKAVGPFTDKILKFETEAPGLHLIYGPNEAGKSSSLRALKALFYGFLQQTPDNFLHSYDQLLVGGHLVNSSGEELVFYRRKKRLGDIIDQEGNPLPATVLSTFLHGVAPEIFESLYGIDHDTLVQGGEEILAQKGEVGQALFAAGAGISSLSKIIDHLEEESNELFKPAGKLPLINKAIAKYKTLQKEIKVASLSCNNWEEHQKSLKEAKEARNKVENEQISKEKEINRLKRLSLAIPELASLDSYSQQLEALGKVVVLPAGFRENHQKVVQNIREVELQLQKDSVRLETLEAKRQALSFDKKLLVQADQIDELHQRLGEYRKGLKDRPEREGMRISLRREAADLLKQVRPELSLDKLESLRVVLARKKGLQRLSGEYEAITQQLLQAEKFYRNAEDELEQLQQGLNTHSKIQEDHKLLQAAKAAQKGGNLDALLTKNLHELESNREKWLAELNRIGLWSGTLEALISLPLPLAETVQQFEKRYSDLADEKRGLKNEKKEAEKELKSGRADYKKLTSSSEIPTEKSLTSAREKRESCWQLLRKRWFQGEDVAEASNSYDPDLSLPDVYEKYVQHADSIGDRLRWEADRVAKVTSLNIQIEMLHENLAELDSKQNILWQQEKSLTDAWTDIWRAAEVSPLSPKEMQGWLLAIDRLRYKAEEIIKKEQEQKRNQQLRAELREGVVKELQMLKQENIPPGDSLAPILDIAETVLENLGDRQAGFEKLQEKQKAALKIFKNRKVELKAAQESLSRWQQLWKKSLSGLGLAEEIATSDAMELMDILQSCFIKVKEADDLKKRIDGIDRDAATFEKDVTSILMEVAPDKAGLPLDQAILQMRRMLNQSQKDRTLFEKLSEEKDVLQSEIAAAKQDLQTDTAQMAEILLTAQCEKQEELTPLFNKLEQHQKLTEKISDIKANLAKIGAGTDIEELASQAKEINVDELPAKIETLQRDITSRLRPQTNELSQIIGEQTSKLAAMDGSARAAEMNEEMQRELARMRRLAERYTLVKLSSHILQLEIERYREEHQDPVLILGSRYFRDITLGSFTGLRTDIDDKGAPILVGIRPGELRVPVTGMSSGTRDQLYLALRLATLEYRLQSQEPLPFIVDDILINFDDERSGATLRALADLATRNQVILFTHHQQVVRETEKLATKEVVAVHTL